MKIKKLKWIHSDYHYTEALGMSFTIGKEEGKYWITPTPYSVFRGFPPPYKTLKEAKEQAQSLFESVVKEYLED